MGEMNRLRIAVCSALAAGALAAVPAMGHNDDVDQPDDTTATMSSQTATTTADSTTAGYGAATAADGTTSSSATATSDEAAEADQARSDSATDPRYATGSRSATDSGNSSATDTTGPNRADLYSSDQATGATSGSSATSGTNSQSVSGDSAQSSQSGSMTTSTNQSTDSQQSGSMTSDADQSTRAQASRSGSNTAPDVVWYVFPLTLQAQSDQLSRGCWVQLYSGDDFEGRYVSVVGPAQIREMASPYGTGMNNWESAIVGPNATVTTYDGENFQSRNATLRAGQRYPDLDDSKLGLFDDIESMKVECTQSGQPGR